VPITTNGVSSNPAHGEVYSIQHYVIKFVSDLSQVGGFLRVLLFPPPLKLTATIIDITQILLKVALNTITLILTLKISGDYIRNKMKIYIFDLLPFVIGHCNLLPNFNIIQPINNVQFKQFKKWGISVLNISVTYPYSLF
jgi:hypothetical protein